MQVILKVGDPEYVLCHGATRGVDLHVGPLNGFGHDSRIRTQIREYVDATHAKPKGRGNRVATIVLVVQREFISLEECTRFTLRYPQELPAEGVVRFISIKPDGSADVQELADAVIEDCYVGPQTGVSTTIRYTIKGSAFTWVN